jgi:hypothetical protein
LKSHFVPKLLLQLPKLHLKDLKVRLDEAILIARRPQYLFELIA